MEFRRVNGLPPYVFAEINGLRAAARAHGRDVIDFGFGNPDLPSPDVAVAKLAEAANNPRNHRYSASRGIPNLPLAMATRYKALFDVDVDPDTPGRSGIRRRESDHGGDVGPRGDDERSRRRLLRRTRGRLGERRGEAAGVDLLVPAQPDECVRGPGLHDATGRVRTRARPDRLSRLR